VLERGLQIREKMKFFSVGSAAADQIFRVWTVHPLYQTSSEPLFNLSQWDQGVYLTSFCNLCRVKLYPSTIQYAVPSFLHLTLHCQVNIKDLG
jgi:hypothetical protein